MVDAQPSTSLRKREGAEAQMSAPTTLARPAATAATAAAATFSTINQPTDHDILAAMLSLQATGSETKVLLPNLAGKVNGCGEMLNSIEHRL